MISTMLSGTSVPSARTQKNARAAPGAVPTSAQPAASPWIRMLSIVPRPRPGDWDGCVTHAAARPSLRAAGSETPAPGRPNVLEPDGAPDTGERKAAGPVAWWRWMRPDERFKGHAMAHAQGGREGGPTTSCGRRG